MKFVFMVALLAWLPNGEGTPDSGHFADPTLSDCHARSQEFSKQHSTPLQLCVKITKAGYDVIRRTEIEFDFEAGGNERVKTEPDEIDRLRAALRAIGRLHRGKTRDSQRVRKIIRGVMK